MLAPNTDHSAAQHSAFEAETEATAQVAALARAVVKAELLLDEETKRLSGFDDLDEQIAQHRRASIKAFAIGASRPDNNLPPALQTRVEARARSQEAFTAYRSTFAELQAELTDALKEQTRAKWKCGQAASVRINSDVEAIVDEIERLRRRECELVDKVKGVSMLRLPSYVGGPLELIRLSPKVQMALLSFRDINDVRPALAGNVASPAAVELKRWEAYLAALLKDPDAIWPTETERKPTNG